MGFRFEIDQWLDMGRRSCTIKLSVDFQNYVTMLDLRSLNKFLNARVESQSRDWEIAKDLMTSIHRRPFC